ncbi:MAG: S49 family peptidase [Gammaproteobacteria bacterium]|nr:S49 family peptidase [Gammaproteobacteria bacterium]
MEEPTQDVSQPDNTGQNKDQQWQQDVINRLAFASLNEQRRSRRWNIFFKSLMFSYLFLILMMIYLPDQGDGMALKHGRHTALVEINGIIADDSEASADTIITGLRAAFKNKDTAGVILRINSPGGSPVQAGYVNDEIKRLRDKYPNTKLYAVVTDICASGGYYIAAAADEIFADKASVIGSIGVIMDGFGFVEGLNKLGIERRLYTAGESKGFLDPFSPEKRKDVSHVKQLLGTIHRQFIDTVKEGRGTRLKDDKRLFTGLVWTGEESVELGLIDGLGSSSYVAREVIEAENIVNYTPTESVLERFAARIGTSFASAVMQVIGTQNRLR